MSCLATSGSRATKLGRYEIRSKIGEGGMGEKRYLLSLDQKGDPTNLKHTTTKPTEMNTKSSYA